MYQILFCGRAAKLGFAGQSCMYKKNTYINTNYYHMPSVKLTSSHVTDLCSDGENDMAMLEYAGCSVAMGNAKPFVKPVAKYVGKSNGEDGLADVLSRIFSINL